MQYKAKEPRDSRQAQTYLRFRSAAVLAFVAATACTEKPKPQRAAPSVAVKPAVKGPLPYVIEANGAVEANRTVTVQSLVSGMMTRVALTEGDEVSQGQILFEIDPRPFRAERDRVQGNLAKDQSQLDRARGDSSRYTALAKDGYVTKQQLDQAFADVSGLTATVAADKASLDKARFDLENAVVRAPISGRTGQLTMKAGNLVRAQSDALVTINELRPVMVRFSIPETDFEEMRRRAGLDKPLTVVVTPSVGDSVKKITGTLTFIDNVVDKATGSVLLKARVANESRLLWPGQFVTVGLELSIDSAAVTVPAEAIVTTAAGTFVYVADAGKAKRLPVKVGRQTAGIVKVDSGLAGGEQVIVEGQNRLTDGAKIEVRDANATAAAAAGGGGARKKGARKGGAGGGDSAATGRGGAGGKRDTSGAGGAAR